MGTGEEVRKLRFSGTHGCPSDPTQGTHPAAETLPAKGRLVPCSFLRSQHRCSLTLGPPRASASASEGQGGCEQRLLPSYPNPERRT
ncbi:hypothetical protein VULLAG_LOCUS20840 [Vulpes lagopus]